MRGSMESRRFRHFWQQARSCRLRLSTACQITLKPRTCRACSLDTCIHTHIYIYIYMEPRPRCVHSSRNIIKPVDQRVGWLARMFPVIYARTSDILFRVITPRTVWKVTSCGLCFAVPPSTVVKWGGGGGGGGRGTEGRLRIELHNQLLVI